MAKPCHIDLSHKITKERQTQDELRTYPSEPYSVSLPVKQIHESGNNNDKQKKVGPDRFRHRQDHFSKYR
jgi:hypothetical protein